MLAAARRDCTSEMAHLVNRKREREEEQEVDISSVKSPLSRDERVLACDVPLQSAGNALRHRDIPKCNIPKFLIMTFLSVTDTYVPRTI